MKMYIGLGNYQSMLSNSRHNIGFKMIESYFGDNNIRYYCDSAYNHIKAIANNWLKDYHKKNDDVELELDSIVAKYIVIDNCYYILPCLGMNNSGVAILALLNELNLNNVDMLSNMMIIVDDIDIKFGKIKLSQTNKSHHNGVKSIQSALKIDKLNLLRVGINKPPKTTSVLDYVLEDFNQEETKDLPNLISKANKAIDIFKDYDISKILSQYTDKINNL